MDSYRGPERRHDHERRRRVAEMTREEMVREVLTDALTGLPNRRAYDEAEAEARAGGYASVDLEGLKWLNDAHGHTVGDAAIRAAGAALTFLAETALLAGCPATAYRFGGDEFVVRFDRHVPDQARALLRGAERVLHQARAPIVSDGRRAGTIGGLRMRWGYGRTLEVADLALLEAPRRAARGEHPAGLYAFRVLGGGNPADGPANHPIRRWFLPDHESG